MLSILIFLLILLVVFVQAMYGFFSSLIMAICTLVCTLLAFSYYEPLAGIISKWQPAHAEAGSLVALLVLPLLLARFLIDKYLPGNIFASVWVDRVGGGLMGLFTGMLLIGTLVIATWMMPVSRDFLGCDPYDNNLAAKDAPVLNAPGFTLSLVESLSAGSMGGKAFTSAHDDLALELWALRNRPAGGRTDCPEKGAILEGFYDVSDINYPGMTGESETFKLMAPDYPGLEKNETKVFVARVKIKPDCVDSDNWWRLPLTHFRIIADNGKSYYPIGYLINSGQWSVVSGEIGETIIARQKDSNTKFVAADLIFRLPLASTPDKPVAQTLSFRRSCNLKLAAKPQAQLPEEADALSMKEVFGKVKVTRIGGGVNSIMKPFEAELTHRLPFTATYTNNSRDQRIHVEQANPDAAVTADLSTKNLVQGIVKGTKAGLESMGGNGRDTGYFDNLFVPKGKKAVLLRCKPLKSDLFIGGLTRDLQFQPMVRVIGQNDIHAAGAWVKWSDAGADYYHLCYRSTPIENQDMTNRTDEAILNVVEKYHQMRKNTEEFVLIFIVPEDKKISGFILGGSERYKCESPLSTGDAPRSSRRRR